MSRRINLFIPGDPRGKGRARMTRQGHVYTPASTVAYESLVRYEAHKAMGASRPVEGPVLLYVAAVFLPPKSFSKGRLAAIADPLHELHDAASVKITKPDLDNIIKAVKDGMNKVVYADDALVACLSASKRYGSPAGVHVTVREWISWDVAKKAI